MGDLEDTVYDTSNHGNVPQGRGYEGHVTYRVVAPFADDGSGMLSAGTKLTDEYEEVKIKQGVDAEECVVARTGSDEAQEIEQYVDAEECVVPTCRTYSSYIIYTCDPLSSSQTNEGSAVLSKQNTSRKVIDTIDADPFIDKLSAQFKDDPIGNKDKKTLEQAKSFKLNNPPSFDEDIREDTSLTVKIKGVHGDTHIHSQPTVKAKPGYNVVLPCTYSTNATTQYLLSLLWTIDGNVVLRIRPGIDATPGIGYEGRVAFVPGNNDASLRINPVYHNDSGIYQCTVSISDENGGTQYAETELLVEDEPQITGIPDPGENRAVQYKVRYLTPNTTYEFSVRAENERENGERTSQYTDTIQGKTKGTLALALINRALIVWICLAMLMKGVRGDTYIYSEPNKTVTVNGQATLMCKYVTNATTQDLMSLTWSRKGNSVLRIRPGIKATPGTGYEGRVAFASGKNDASLKIGPVYHNDSGTYRCTVSISDENGGTQYAETELLVEDAVTTTQHADLVSTTSASPPPPPPPPPLWMRIVGSIFCVLIFFFDARAFRVGHRYRHYEFKESDFTCADACTCISNMLKRCVLLAAYCIFMMIGIGVLIGLWTATSDHDVQVLLVISIVTCLLLLLIIINQSVVTQCGRRPKQRIKDCHVGHLDVNLKFGAYHVTQESDAGEPV